MCQRMLDVEVILVVEDGDGLAGRGSGSGIGGGGGVVAALGRDRDGGQVDLLSHLGWMV